jgi:hypothetical protein
MFGQCVIFTASLQSGCSVTADRNLKRPFDETISLHRGRQLVTLLDAATYATKLPKKEADTAEWQAAIESLILVATLGSPTMFARIGVMRALMSPSAMLSSPSAAKKCRSGVATTTKQLNGHGSNARPITLQAASL